MKKSKYFKISGVFETPVEMTLDEGVDWFVHMIETFDGYFGGGIEIAGDKEE